jgi:V/A-type H+-transporting ATPase subunit C
LTQTTRYASVLAKIGAQKSALLSDTKLKTLAEIRNFTDFASQLRDSSYQEQISKLTSPLTGRKLERALNENLIEIYEKIIKYSPKTVTAYLKLYLLRFEVENIKLLANATVAKLSAEQKLCKLYPFSPCYIKKRLVFEEAAKAQNLTQMVHAFQKTPYWSPLSMGLDSYNEGGSTVSLDVFVDGFFYEKLYSAFEALPRKEKPRARFYASMENDTYILLSLLRGKNLNYDSNWLRVAVPHCYFNLKGKEAEAIISALTFEAALKIALDSHYGRYFSKEATPEETLSNAERNIKKAIFGVAKGSVVSSAFSIATPLSFMTQKEVEVYNLRTLALGIDAAMKPDAIRELLL